MTGEDRPLAPSGWYPDPRERGQERYWDGATWSDDTRPTQPRADALPADWALPEEPAPAAGATAAPRPGTAPAQLDPFQPIGLGRGTPPSRPDGRAPVQPGVPGEPGQPVGGHWQRKDRPAAHGEQPSARSGALPSASFGARVVATLVDFLLVSLVASLLMLPFLLGNADLRAQLEAAGTDFSTMMEVMASLSPRVQLLNAAIQFAVWFGYGGIMLQTGGATLGQRLMGLRTLARDDSRLTANRAWGRSFAWALLSTIGSIMPFVVIPLFSCLRVLFSPSRQTLHDAVLGTRVVRQR